MSKIIPSLIILVLVIGCGQQPGPSKPKPAAKDPRLEAIEQKIASTTPDGKAMIEKVKAMKPEVNDQASAEPLGRIIEDYVNNRGNYGIKEIGWEASQKGNKRWKVLFYYQDYQDIYQTAEWEYNPETGKLYPFEFVNAKHFWTNVAIKEGN